METDAIYLIMSKTQQGLYLAVKSNIHEIEISAISNIQERTEIFALMSKFESQHVIDLIKLRKRAEYLNKLGFGVADAAHLAYAEKTADAFITCDDKLLKKSKKENIHINTYNPVEFVIEEDLK